MESKPNAYQKVTTSLTPEQHQWVRQVAAKAQLKGLSINAPMSSDLPLIGYRISSLSRNFAMRSSRTS